MAQSLTQTLDTGSTTLRAVDQDPTLLALIAEASELDDAQRQVLVATARAMRGTSDRRRRHQAIPGGRHAQEGLAIGTRPV